MSKSFFTPEVPSLRYVNYRTLEENLMDREAVVVPVPFSLEGLSDEQIVILQRLEEAAQGISPIAARQYDERVIPMYRALEHLERTTDDAALRNDLHDYLDILAAMNHVRDSTDAFIPFPGSPDRIPQGHPAAEFRSLLFEPVPIPPGKGFYPVGMTDAEFDALGATKDIVNSVVLRTPEGYRVVLNEEHFRRELAMVRSDLQAALAENPSPELAAYMRATLAELKSGSPESRWNSDLAWIRNTGTIDFRLRTADELYEDEWKGVRGCASGSVMVTDHHYMDLCRRISALIMEIESTAPWTHKKTPDPKALPKLKFVNILNWSGDYDKLPFTTSAQSLPNDKRFIDQEGSVLMIYRNIQEAIRNTGTFDMALEEFIPRSELGRYRQHMSLDVGLKMTIAHEQGHTTGGRIITAEPSTHFGKNYSIMEECRAELISMFALPMFAREGIVKPEEVVGGYYYMLASIIHNLQSNPLHHAGARKMMFNYFLERGAVRQVEEDSKDKYVVDAEKMPLAVNDMLRQIGDFKATGDTTGLEAFRGRYFSADPVGQQRHFRERLAALPRGRLLLFPRIEGRQLAYPTEYRAQYKTLGHSAKHL